jgi:YVTN family beta-propeller protein
MQRPWTAGVNLCVGAVLVAALLIGEAWAAEVWVTNMKSANLQVFDPATLKVVATIPADKGAHNVTFSPD